MQAGAAAHVFANVTTAFVLQFGGLPMRPFIAESLPAIVPSAPVVANVGAVVCAIRSWFRATTPPVPWGVSTTSIFAPEPVAESDGVVDVDGTIRSVLANCAMTGI